MAAFAVPGVALLLIEPWTFPAALVCFAHAWAIPSVQARRGARSVVPIGSERSAAGTSNPDRVALGLLADLVGQRERELLAATGLARQASRRGTWLIGEQGAFLVRGRRVYCWCVRVGDAKGLPAADRVAHLLLALREDEDGFATVANLAFSGARWRVRRHLPDAASAALASSRCRES